MPKVPEYNLSRYEPSIKRKRKHKQPAPRTNEELDVLAQLQNLRLEIKRIKSEMKALKERSATLAYMRRSGVAPPTLKLYALKLEDECWYVGMTHNVDKRFGQHLKGKGSAFTKMHRPIEIVEIRETESRSMDEVSKLEDDMTLEYALKYGSNAVRGGGFCQMKPYWPDVVRENESSGMLKF